MMGIELKEYNYWRALDMKIICLLVFIAVFLGVAAFLTRDLIAAIESLVCFLIAIWVFLDARPPKWVRNTVREMEP